MKWSFAATLAILSLLQGLSAVTVNIPGQGTILGSETEGAFTGNCHRYHSSPLPTPINL